MTIQPTRNGPRPDKLANHYSGLKHQTEKKRNLIMRTHRYRHEVCFPHEPPLHTYDPFFKDSGAHTNTALFILFILKLLLL